MNNSKTIRLKAAVFMIIFSLNMIVGFACATGLTMGFNATHHNNEEITKVHIHADGKKHHHEQKSDTHHHKQEKDNCCSDSVIKISQADKAMPQVEKLLHPAFFLTIVEVCYRINLLYPSQIKVSSKYFVRGHHPPIPDIRVAIQSFQI